MGHRLYVTLIRHAETDWNRAERLQGHQDVALNEAGLCQVDALVARYLQSRVARGAAARGRLQMVGSDLLRCRQTAEPLALAAGVVARWDAGWRERHFGAFEGRTLTELAHEHPEWVARWRARDLDFAPPGGETLRAFAQRIDACLARCLHGSDADEWVVVTHGGVLDIIDRRVRGLDLVSPRSWKAANAGMYVLEWHSGRFEILDWDQASLL